MAFDDPNAIYADDDGGWPSEDRGILIGMQKGAILFVVYVLRAHVTRIISARYANRHEQKVYFSNIAP